MMPEKVLLCLGPHFCWQMLPFKQYKLWLELINGTVVGHGKLVGVKSPGEATVFLTLGLKQKSRN